MTKSFGNIREACSVMWRRGGQAGGEASRLRMTANDVHSNWPGGPRRRDVDHNDAIVRTTCLTTPYHCDRLYVTSPWYPDIGPPYHLMRLLSSSYN